MHIAQYWIDKLEMKPHPEGGYYREYFKSPSHVISPEGNERSTATSIFYLLEVHDHSHFHRLGADEVWYYHAGQAADIHFITPDGQYYAERIGPSDNLQVIIPKGHIFGANLPESSSYILVGCMVAPGFEFEDFEMISRATLREQCPQHKQIIERLTHPE
ncbi:MAG: cupin domain-containing protein [Bacteroidota bacterium]